ncbi:unnamed protein product [Polarella glacialis]|uniref:Calmodulin-lysine N-methyltransferase n=1 Tax=Polarella glacialis TaxID=89957 RepID=A0A813HAU9_POLGL|nr:unnamed protein product [Polarella glacialis]CAE8678040.1 unnamed protein product [Polarella glacialis]
MLMPGDAPPVDTIRRLVAGGGQVVAVTGGEPPPVLEIEGAGVAALRVSPDAVAMLRWLDTDPEALPTGAAVFLELGAGHGLLGLACAAMRPDARLVLTDAADVLPFAERSVAANEPSLARRCFVRPLAFSDAAALEDILQEFAYAGPGESTVDTDSGEDVTGSPLPESNQRGGCEAALGRGNESTEPCTSIESLPVVAIGAGICYWEVVYKPLAETLAQLCSKGRGYAILGYFRRDWKVEKRFWTKVLQQQGLQAEVLWEGEVDEPENPSAFAPACSRTSGEWNARVYRISAAAVAVASAPGAEAAEAGSEPWRAYEAESYDKKKKAGCEKGSKQGKKGR